MLENSSKTECSIIQVKVEFMKFYLDTCIWIDRLDFQRRNHYKAKKLFQEIEENSHKILVAWIHQKETKNTGYYAEYSDLERDLYEKGVCFGIRTSEIDRQIAFRHNEYLNKGFDDCLHLHLAKRHGAKATSADSHWKEIGKVMGIRVYDYEGLKRLGIDI